MRIQHISCGSFHPPLRRLTEGCGSFFERARYVVHCLLIELDDRLVLVDTGLSNDDMQHPLRRLGMGMAWGGRARKGTTAREHVLRFGFKSEAVTDILMTHLDKDHAGGLADFPQARVHVHPAELDAALTRSTFIHRQRYNPWHFAHNPHWVELEVEKAEPWQGLEGVLRIANLPDSMRMIPLPGHSPGHCGVAVQSGDGRWLLHAGDAVYHSAWLHGSKAPFVVRTVERILQSDGQALMDSRATLAQLVQQGDVIVCTSHDRDMFGALGGVE